MRSLRQKLYSQLLNAVDEKIGELQKEIEAIHASIANETKSSAGDKYETTRAMLQIELEQLNRQTANALEQKKMIQSIESAPVNNRISNGNLIKTNHGYFFLAIGIGRIEVDAIPVIVLSAVSPLGLKLNGLQVNDQFSINDRIFRIKEIE